MQHNKTLTLTYRKYITTNHFQEGAVEPTKGNIREQDGKADTTKVVVGFTATCAISVYHH
jgi:hypothetical protein